jgi:hypothetical protein
MVLIEWQRGGRWPQCAIALGRRRGVSRGAGMPPESAVIEQIGQRAGHDEAMSVLPEPAIAHLGEAEDPLDDPDRVLDPRFREGRLLARTFDLVRFFARSIWFTMPQWR